MPAKDKADSATARGGVDADILVEYRGAWMTYAAFERARLDALMPPQPKKPYRRGR